MLDAGSLPPGTAAALYAASKQAAEALLAPYPLDLSVLRLWYPFGPDHPCFVRLIAAGLKAGRPVTLGGSDGLTINPIAVEDAAAAIVAALDRPGTHDVCGPEQLTLRDLATRLATRLAVDPVFEHDAGAPDRVQTGDWAQTEALLGRPLEPLDAGLDRLAAATVEAA